MKLKRLRDGSLFTPYSGPSSAQRKISGYITVSSKLFIPIGQSDCHFISSDYANLTLKRIRIKK